MKIIKNLFKLILSVILIIALILGGIILYATITAYKPELSEIVKTDMPDNDKASDFSIVPDNLNLVIWNIGFAGLGEEMDFFYDGGKMVRPTKEQNQKYYKGINNFIISNKSTDFVLLQEVDRKSKRSYKVDQYNGLKNMLQDHFSAFAFNYKCGFVPLPFTNPLGKVESGLASYSKYKPLESIRYQFPGDFSWPKHLFMLKRCFLFQRYKTENGKELIVVNTHNSAYDSGGFLKKKQMEFLKEFLVKEYQKGNYVVVGGDWNQIPPDFDNLKFKKSQEASEQIPVSENYIPDWKWVYDNNIATNRKLNKPFNRKETFTTIIDFFLLSPNIKVNSVKGFNQNFKFSDHQAQKIKITLLN